MASTDLTPRGVKAVHGMDPQVRQGLPNHSLATVMTADIQNLVEKVIRARIYDSLYWKEHCFALNGELTWVARIANAQPSRSLTRRLHCTPSAACTTARRRRRSCAFS